MNTLYPISSLPPDAGHDTVQLYEEAKGWYGLRGAPTGVQECIVTCPRRGDDPKLVFLADVQGAKWWCPRERPRMQFPKLS